MIKIRTRTETEKALAAQVADREAKLRALEAVNTALLQERDSLLAEGCGLFLALREARARADVAGRRK